jgi:3-hydroxy-9,10-secoandrosta-1,3,5(10)-triene-9,17-dione monooxygenase reductase component
MSTADVVDTAIDPGQFRGAMASFPAGVTIITTEVEGKPCGTTVSAFSSLSLDPPLVLVCLAKTSRTLQEVRRSGRFCVNILAAGQEDMAYAFAKSGANDRFDTTDYASGVIGDPVLAGCAATVECSLHESFAGGDHDILVGRPQRIAVDPAAAPLVHARGRLSAVQSH